MLRAALVVAAIAAQSPYGAVNFPTSCAPELNRTFQTSMSMLYSFWYDGARAGFLSPFRPEDVCT